MLNPVSYENLASLLFHSSAGERLQFSYNWDKGNTRNFTLRVGFIGIVQSRRKSIGPGLSNLCTQSVLTRPKLVTCYSTDKKCQKTFTSFFFSFLTQISYDVRDKENLGNQTVCLFS